jgi:hypothetical protein
MIIISVPTLPNVEMRMPPGSRLDAPLGNHRQDSDYEHDDDDGSDS